MGSVENGVNNQVFENDEISGTAGTDFANDWEVSHRSTPNTINSRVLYPCVQYFLFLDFNEVVS